MVDQLTNIKGILLEPYRECLKTTLMIIRVILALNVLTDSLHHKLKVWSGEKWAFTMQELNERLFFFLFLILALVSSATLGPCNDNH